MVLAHYVFSSAKLCGYREFIDSHLRRITTRLMRKEFQNTAVPFGRYASIPQSSITCKSIRAMENVIKRFAVLENRATRKKEYGTERRKEERPYIICCPGAIHGCPSRTCRTRPTQHCSAQLSGGRPVIYVRAKLLRTSASRKTSCHVGEKIQL